MEHIGPISGVTYKNGLVATAGYDNQVILWNHADRTAIARGVHDHLANQCVFNPDASLLASASSDYSVRIWSLPTMRLQAVLIGHTDDVEMVAFSPDGTKLATCSRDHTVRIWSVEGGSLVCCNGHQDDVISVTWTADGKEVLSSSDDGTVRRWEASTGHEIGLLDAEGVQTDALAIRHDGLLFAGDDQGRIALIEDDRHHFISAHQAGIKRLVLSEKGDKLASLSYDRSLIVWSIQEDGSLSKITTVDFPPVVWPRSAAFTGDNEIVFGTFGSTYASLHLPSLTWETDHITPDLSVNAISAVEGCLVTVGDAGRVYGLGATVQALGSLCNFLLPFGTLLLTGGQLGILFDAKTGRALHQFRAPLNCAASFHRNGTPHVIVGTYTGEGLVFREEDGALTLVAVVQLHDNAVKGVAANQEIIFSVCASAAVAMHASHDFSLVRKVAHGHERIANGCCVVQDGFASIGRDLYLRLWLKEADVAIKSPHSHSIKCIAVDASGSRVLTGSYGGTVAIYDLVTQTWSPVSRPTAAGISSACFDAATSRFVVVGYDGKQTFYS